MDKEIQGEGVTADAARERHFMPAKRLSWSSAFLLIGLGLGALFLASLAAKGWWRVRHDVAFNPALVIVLVMLACALLLFYLSWHTFRRRPALTLSRQGISSSQWRQTVAWESIDDVELKGGVGHGFLELTLRTDPGMKPHRGLWGQNATVRRINISELKSEDQSAAYAAIHAQVATLREVAGLGLVPSVPRAREAVAFEEQLDIRVPTPWALILVMAINVCVWLLHLFAGIAATKPLPADLFAWGANSAHAVTQEHQYWRLLTATFLHAGAMHLALNMYALMESGRQICRWFGNSQFLLIYLGSALAGSALSLHFSSQHSVSVGASGAVFGVLGALVMAVWLHRERIPALTSRRLMISQGLFIVYALLLGFTGQRIDNAVHLGGLVAGVLMTWLLVEQISGTASARLRRRGQVLATGLVSLLAGMLVWTTPATGINHRQLFDSHVVFTEVMPRLKAVEQALQNDAQAAKEGRMSGEQFIEQLERIHIPAYEAINVALLPVNFPTGVPVKIVADDIKTANRLVTEIMRLEVRKARGDPDPVALDGQLRVLNEQLQTAKKRLNDFPKDQKGFGSP